MAAAIVVLGGALAGAGQGSGEAGRAAPVAATTLAGQPQPAASVGAGVTVTETVTAEADPHASTVTVTETVVETVAETNRPTPTPPPAVATGRVSGEIGAPVPQRWTSWDDSTAAGSITVHEVRRVDSFPGAFEDEIPAGDHFLVIDVSYDIERGSVTYNPYDWRIKDADGRVFENALVFSLDEPRLSAGELTGPDKTRGVVVFDVPGGDLRLDYMRGFDDLAVSWEIPVG